MGKKKKKITVEGPEREEKTPDDDVLNEENAGTVETGSDADKETEAGKEPGAEEEANKETAAEEAEAEPEAPASEEAAEEKGSAGFFKKKKTDEKDEKIAELTDRLQRQMAEFENFRKRTDKEKSTMYDMGAKDIIEKLLPVVDNFERGLDGADEKDPFAEGMAMIYKQLMTMLTESGVAPIEAEGKEFDPNLHNAVMHVDDEQFGENIVAEELQKGYTYKDHVVRHSMVKVAN